MNILHLRKKFIMVRANFEKLCATLLIEDYSVQPIDFVSPPKWHLAHTTWFWETFVLTRYVADYKVFNDDFSYLFNSYYNNVGERVLRPLRGVMTRPSVEDVYTYRDYVTKAMETFLERDLEKEILDIIAVGINHEEQHQELFVYDIKYILGHQPTFPIVSSIVGTVEDKVEPNFIRIVEGIYTIGHQEQSFCFDNELGVHKVYINTFEIANQLVTNESYIAFIENGGYQNFNLWHDDGWHWINNNGITAPLYWHKIDGEWYHYDKNGLEKIPLNEPAKHISFYEAFAYAEYMEMRLPTEFEWEIASEHLNWGTLWEWTNSAYLPYPNFNKIEGALGEYNGKFMINTMVMRGASGATPKEHSRKTYRNFFHPNMRWQYSGIRLIKK